MQNFKMNLPQQLNQMTLDVSSQDRKNKKVSKIDLINRRYSNPNDHSNDATLDGDSSLIV
jgi:hypothetical protein